MSYEKQRRQSDKVFEGKRILITGGTGSLGKTLTKRLLSGRHGTPERVLIFSRDEAKQHDMRMAYLQRRVATDEIVYENFSRTLGFIIGDVRDPRSIDDACAQVDIVFNAAALKQVPSCEYFPYEAVRTNIEGAENIVRALGAARCNVETVVGISTDKACQPVNVMGMSKALQERVFISANLQRPDVRFVAARYGNVLASRGSVVPLFHDQILNGGPVTLTTKAMTRFLLSLEQAVDTIVAAVQGGERGEIYIPQVPAARISDLASAMIGDRDVDIEEIGIRPGEKLHEALVSYEEAARTIERDGFFVIKPMLNELGGGLVDQPALADELSSDKFLMTFDETLQLLHDNQLLIEQVPATDPTLELLR
ncbi:MAG: polysaccharide biosynthesis protein [Acidimicrobiales bacterium]